MSAFPDPYPSTDLPPGYPQRSRDLPPGHPGARPYGTEGPPTTQGPAAGSATGPLLAAALAGAAVSLALGTYGRVHEPTGGTITTFGFPTLISMKVWITTGVFVLALAQLTSALAMWGHLPGVKTRPPWLPAVHRWTGTLAFVGSLPVAYHCLWSLGFQDTDTRVLAHALAGCAFYGAVTTKLLALRIDGLPRFTLPFLGGLLVTGLTVIWLTSSLWFFTNVDFPAV
jgi:hypothetical protein